MRAGNQAIETLGEVGLELDGQNHLMTACVWTRHSCKFTPCNMRLRGRGEEREREREREREKRDEGTRRRRGREERKRDEKMESGGKGVKRKEQTWEERKRNLVTLQIKGSKGSKGRK